MPKVRYIPSTPLGINGMVSLPNHILPRQTKPFGLGCPPPGRASVRTGVGLVAVIIIFFAITAYAISEVVVLKDGSKYIGKVTDEGDKIKIATEHGELTIKKEEIKAIYKDAPAIVKETSDILTAAQKLIDGANKIEDSKERNATLDRAIEMLQKGQATCLDVIDIFSGKDAEAINTQLRMMNTAIKQARSLKVLAQELPPPPQEKEPPPPPKKPEIGKEKLKIAREFYEFGVTAFNEKQYEKARDLFINAISYYYIFPEAFHKLAETYTMLKEEEDAYENYRKCIGAIDSLASPSEEMAKLRQDAVGKSAKFRPLDDKITDLNNNLINNLMEVANQCITKEDYLLAEELLLIILKIDSNIEDASKSFELVKEKLSKAIEPEQGMANDELANLFYQSGLTLMKENKFLEATEKFKKALSYRRDFPDVLFNLGECCKITDTKNAIKYFRLAIKSIKQPTVSEKDEELLSQICQSLERIDENTKRCTNIKNIYISSLLPLAEDCFEKKYMKFAERLIDYLLAVDSSNKNIQELSNKLDASKTTALTASKEEPKNDKPKPETAPKKEPPQELFNGKDIANWEVRDKPPRGWKRGTGSVKPNYWSVKEGKIESDQKYLDYETDLLWKGTPPEKYTLTVKFSIGQTRSSKISHAGIIYGVTKGSFDIISFESSLCSTGINKVELIRENDTYKVILNGKTIQKNMSKPLTPAIGLTTINALVYFHSVTLQEIK